MAAINDNIAALDKSVIEICNKLVDNSQRNTMSIEQQFNAAVNVIRNLPKNGKYFVFGLFQIYYFRVVFS